MFRRLLTELDAEKSLVAGLRCEMDELRQSHASQLEQYSEKTRAVLRYLRGVIFGIKSSIYLALSVALRPSLSSAC